MCIAVNTKEIKLTADIIQNGDIQTLPLFFHYSFSFETMVIGADSSRSRFTVEISTYKKKQLVAQLYIMMEIKLIQCVFQPLISCLNDITCFD